MAPRVLRDSTDASGRSARRWTSGADRVSHFAEVVFAVEIQPVHDANRERSGEVSRPVRVVAPMSVNRCTGTFTDWALGPGHYDVAVSIAG